MNGLKHWLLQTLFHLVVLGQLSTWDLFLQLVAVYAESWVDYTSPDNDVARFGHLVHILKKVV